ncbi:MAG: zinc ABC transporter substrate-binding protein [Alphaproteobacteria bacterium]|nr:zinc ABC transporter substrate-binding protein [Alphaproteobacteria bacterium]MBV9693288.1 zinc ABC transporter substrate-binding protein [Alphaproteobacteria bacterium]
MRKLVIAAALGVLGLSSTAQANVSIFACEPEWGALAKEVGGDKVSVYNATTGAQDPHQIQARPSLIAKARGADLTVCDGAELEIGWLPMILQQADNPKIAVGQPGAFDATNYVHLLEQPSRLDRAEGDIHAAGNPHIQTDPRMMLPISHALAARLAQIDPGDAAYFGQRESDFEKRWTAAIAKWTQEAAPLRGINIAVQHHAWIYMENWLGLHEVVPLEPKPGVPPSSGYLAEVLQKLQATPAKFVIRAAYEDDRPSEFIAEHAGIPAVKLPFTVGGTDGAKDLFSLYEDTISRMLAGLKK